MRRMALNGVSCRKASDRAVEGRKREGGSYESSSVRSNHCAE